MKILRIVNASALSFFIFFAATTTASAERGRGDRGHWNGAPHGDQGHRNVDHGYNGPGRKIDRGRGDPDRRGNAPPRGYRFDHRYHHDRYYPPRGRVVNGLPRGYHAVPYHGRHYYYYGGVWYRPHGTRFVVINPPVGLVVSVLPPFYTTIWVAGVPYYYADGVYYVWRPAERAYVVTEAPAESAVTTLPTTPEQLFIYPKNGQSEQQQATDRYECHHWAAGQTGFDPTQPLADLSTSQIAEKRAAYQRAMTACLEARGYSVR
jgi:hypothetical protein